MKFVNNWIRCIGTGHLNENCWWSRNFHPIKDIFVSTSARHNTATLYSTEFLNLRYMYTCTMHEFVHGMGILIFLADFLQFKWVMSLILVIFSSRYFLQGTQ